MTMAHPTQESLLEANQQFYEAFETLNTDHMTRLWEESDRVYCVHPGWNPIQGYDKVVRSFQQIFSQTGAIHFSLSIGHAHLLDTLGVVTLVENVISQTADDPISAAAATTNLFGFDPSSGLWKIFHHHSSILVANPAFPADVLN